MKYRSAAAIMLLVFSTMLISCTIPSAMAGHSEHLGTITRNGLDLGEGDEEDEGGFHVPLFALATFLGLVAGVTGIKNSSYRGLRELVPIDIPRRLHRYASIACWSLFMLTFMLWVPTYYSEKERIFHTIHGMLALSTFIFASASIITGAGMMRSVKRWRLIHLVVSNLAFVLLVLTDLAGIALED